MVVAVPHSSYSRMDEDYPPKITIKDFYAVYYPSCFFRFQGTACHPEEDGVTILREVLSLNVKKTRMVPLETLAWSRTS